MTNCKACLEPQHCDCLCNTCKVSRKTERLYRECHKKGLEVSYSTILEIVRIQEVERLVDLISNSEEPIL